MKGVLTMKVRALERYNDIFLSRPVEKNEVLEMDEERVKVLLGDNEYKRAFVEVIEEDAKEVEVVETKKTTTRRTRKVK